MVAARAAPHSALPVTCTDKDGRPFSVRRFDASDRAALESFYLDFEPKRAAQGLPPAGLPAIRRWLDTILPTGVHLIVETGDRLSGHAMLIPTSRSDTSEYAIFLDEAVRGHGLGTRVNLIAVDVARALGLRRLWLSVEPHNRPAVRSYQKAGFRFVGATIFSSEVEMELELAGEAE